MRARAVWHALVMMRAPENNDTSLELLVGGALALGALVIVAVLIVIAAMLV